MSLYTRALRPALFGGQLQLEGYRVEEIEPGRKQLWLAWRTVAPTSPGGGVPNGIVAAGVAPGVPSGTGVDEGPA